MVNNHDRLCNLLNIKYPILQGGMAWVATGELAAAVSEAGGLGIIGAGHAPPEVVEDDIKKVKKLTSNPFGVNVMLLSPYAEEIIELVLKEKVPVVTTGAGNPGKYMEDFKKAGTRVFPVVASVALAKRLERQGVDGIIAEGMEGGGHIGDIATMVLIPQVVDTVNIPVIAAGGIVDGRGLAAALALGASGVQMATRFICAEECQAHPNYKEAVIKAKDRDTVICGRSTGHPVRVIKNKLTRKLEKLEEEGASREELEELGIGKLKSAVIEGDVTTGSLMAGQCAALVNTIQPAGEIIREVVTEASKIMENMSEIGRSFNKENP